MATARYGSDLLVDVLRAQGMRYVSFNPGATFRGLHDSLTAYAGNENPEVITCCHEEIAVGVAHGYAKAAGHPMAVVLHNVVGVLHASMAVFNAWSDRVPMLLLGGSGPRDETLRRPWIDWIHTADQGEVLRHIVKWEDEPATLEGAADSMLRGLQVALTPPMGPVYISIDTDVQESPSTQGMTDHVSRRVEQIDRYGPPSRPVLAEEQVRAAARVLVDAEAPIILTNALRPERGAPAALLELAEMLDAPVYEWIRGGIALPNRHPLNVTTEPLPYVKDADVVLSLNVQHLAIMASSIDEARREVVRALPDTARIIAVTDDVVPRSSWSAEHGPLEPSDMLLGVSPGQALPALVQACREDEALRKESRRRRQARVDRWSTRRDELQASWDAAARDDGSPMHTARVMGDLWSTIKDHDWVLASATTPTWAYRLWDWDDSSRYLGDNGGAGKGYGLAAAMGAALAFRGTGKLCIDLQGDGDLLYTSSGLWTAAHHALPVLIVVLNNRSYYTDERHQNKIAELRDRPYDVGVGVKITDPTPDYASIAKGFGVYGAGPTEDPEELIPTFKAAIDHIATSGQPALVDCVIRAE